MSRGIRIETLGAKQLEEGSTKQGLEWKMTLIPANSAAWHSVMEGVNRKRRAMVRTELRSPRSKLAGWVHLPRIVDKIRMAHSGLVTGVLAAEIDLKLDECWLNATKVDLDKLAEFVTQGKNDEEVEAWMQANSNFTPEEIELFNASFLGLGRDTDSASAFARHKADAGLNHRKDVQTFVDMIDAYEGRL
jgi:hypothetical protein